MVSDGLIVAVPCPLCGCAGTSVRNEIPIAELIRDWERAFHIDVSAYFQSLRRLDLFACERCALEFYVPLFLEGSSELYSQLQKFDWYYTPHKWEHDIALRDLSGCRRILEIGSGSGVFIARAQAEKGLKVQGIESNAEAVSRAQSLGLPVESIDLCQAALRWPAHYDAVCAFQVLEHLSNPKEFLESCCELLTAGGRLLVGVPNAESFLQYQFNPLDMPPHHVTKWSRRALGYLPNLFPLRLIDIKREPLAPYHVRDYVHAHCGFYVRKGVPKRLCPRWLQRAIADLVKATGLRKMLVGQTLYASFQRT